MLFDWVFVSMELVIYNNLVFCVVLMSHSTVFIVSVYWKKTHFTISYVFIFNTFEVILIKLLVQFIDKRLNSYTPCKVDICIDFANNLLNKICLPNITTF